ncbi:MAG: hypothetical protein HY773_00850 [Candidatus Terrybacteria bacterium]|nr:hypothetical protein [Candidatus Terrybacteria bacterium]
MEIIPAINVDNFEEIQKRIKLVEPYAPPAGGWVQIDVADGTFTKNTLWHNPTDLAFLQTSLNIELHLMINNVDYRIIDWLLPNIKRIVFHIGSSDNPGFVIDKSREYGKEVGIAIAPNESLSNALSFKEYVDLFQILGVSPGLPGQKLEEITFERIREVRKFCPLCIIEVDGGMNKETAKKAIEAGANIIVAASAIFNSKDIRRAIKELNALI